MLTQCQSSPCAMQLHHVATPTVPTPTRAVTSTVSCSRASPKSASFTTGVALKG